MAQEKNKGIDGKQLEILLTDQLKALEANNDLLTTITDKLENLSSNIRQLMENKEPATTKPTPMEVVLKDLIKHDLSEMKEALLQLRQETATQKQPRVWRPKLFSRESEKRFYKFLLAVLATVSVVISVYKFAVHYSDNRQALEQYQLQHDTAVNAWHELYKRQNESGKRRMDSVWRNAVQQKRRFKIIKSRIYVFSILWLRLSLIHYIRNINL
jgi:hypothetical protein